MASDEIGGMCRFYDKEFPDVEESVIVNVKRIAEMGAYVQVRGRRARLRVPSFLAHGQAPLCGPCAPPGSPRAPLAPLWLPASPLELPPWP